MRKVFKSIIDELKKAARSELKIYGGARANGKSILLGYQKGLEDAVYIVNQVVKEYNNGWIPCSERLPEKHQVVMCSVNKAYATRVIVLQSFDGAEYWYNGVIEAWQPLPEPYEKGESNAKSNTRIQE